MLIQSEAGQYNFTHTLALTSDFGCRTNRKLEICGVFFPVITIQQWREFRQCVHPVLASPLAILDIMDITMLHRLTKSLKSSVNKLLFFSAGNDIIVHASDCLLQVQQEKDIYLQ